MAIDFNLRQAQKQRKAQTLDIQRKTSQKQHIKELGVLYKKVSLFNTLDVNQKMNKTQQPI